jgi:hypothetical protein
MYFLKNRFIETGSLPVRPVPVPVLIFKTMAVGSGPGQRATGPGSDTWVLDNGASSHMTR